MIPPQLDGEQRPYLLDMLNYMELHCATLREDVHKKQVKDFLWDFVEIEVRKFDLHD